MRAEHTVKFWNALLAEKLNPEDYCLAKDIAEDLNTTTEKVHWMLNAGWINHIRVGKNNSPVGNKNRMYAIPEDEAILIASHKHSRIEEILAYAGHHDQGSQRWRRSAKEGEATEEQTKESASQLL